MQIWTHHYSSAWHLSMSLSPLSLPLHSLSSNHSELFAVHWRCHALLLVHLFMPFLLSCMLFFIWISFTLRLLGHHLAPKLSLLPPVQVKCQVKVHSNTSLNCLALPLPVFNRSVCSVDWRAPWEQKLSWSHLRVSELCSLKSWFCVFWNNKTVLSKVRSRFSLNLESYNSSMATQNQ